jgi:hypothetical protein
LAILRTLRSKASERVMEWYRRMDVRSRPRNPVPLEESIKDFGTA